MGHTKHAPVIIISGGMGSGKGTVVHALEKELGLTWIKTHTTRPMRHDDAVISHRVFDTEVNFLRHLDRGEVLVPTKLAGHYYGLFKEDLDHELRQNKPIILEITVDGGVELAKLYPHSILIFITADPKDVLKRIAHRHMEKTEIKERLALTQKEEKLAKKHYDYLIENVQGAPGATIESIKELIVEKFPELTQD